MGSTPHGELRWDVLPELANRDGESRKIECVRTVRRSLHGQTWQSQSCCHFFCSSVKVQRVSQCSAWFTEVNVSQTVRTFLSGIPYVVV